MVFKKLSRFMGILLRNFSRFMGILLRNFSKFMGGTCYGSSDNRGNPAIQAVSSGDPNKHIRRADGVR